MSTALNPPARFRVVAARSGVSCVVEKDDSITDALETVGIKIKTSCGGGGCGTCLVQVLEGTPEHNDVYLTPAERAAGQFLPCCGRSLTETLVLDV